jgi:hypothetical protein
MGTKVNSNYEDLLTFTRASKGHALRPVSYGDELSEGSDFSSWDNNSTFPFDTFTVGSSSLTVANSTGKTSVASHPDSISLVSGRLYVVDVEFSITSGTFDFSIREQATTTVIAEGEDVGAGETQQRITFVSDVTATTVIQLTSRSGTANATIDNVSVKEVTFDQPDGTLTLFEHPENVPRVEYDADGNRLGLLVEEARTNQFIESEDFVGSAWYSQLVTATQDAVGPDKKANSAATITDDNSGGTGEAYVLESVSSLTTGNDYTASVFAKAGSNSWIALKVNALGISGNLAYFDLSNGVLGSVGAGVTATMEDYGNGWYRCSTTFEAGSDTSGSIRIQIAKNDNNKTLNLDGTNSILIFGAQLEEGSFPTSYMKTEGSTASRSADVASIPVADFGWNNGEGTLFADYRTFSTKATWREAITLSSTVVSPANYIVLRVDPSDNKDYQGYSANSLEFDLQTSGYSTGDFVKTAGAYKTNDFAASHDGNILTDTSGNPPESVFSLQIGRHFSSRQLNGHIKSIKYYPRRLTNAQLQDLTS